VLKTFASSFGSAYSGKIFAVAQPQKEKMGFVACLAG